MAGKDIHLPQEIASSYDYIIVGSGSAGSVLATELSRLQVGTILLIEEGQKAGHYQSRRPALYPHLFQNPTISHADRTVPQSTLAGRSLSLPSGKGLGGSSLLNAMILSCPHPADLERWNQLLGATWKTTLLRELLDELLELLHTHFDGHPELHPISQEILQRMDTKASPPSLFAYNRLVKNGRRESIWRILKNFRSANGIQILRGYKVERVDISGDRAIGVTCNTSSQNSLVSIRAKQAVILSAGTLKTPLILMKSGIGKKENISTHRSLVIESPRVGENLSDHLVFPITFTSTMPSLPSYMDRDMNRAWIKKGWSPLTSNIAELGAFGWHNEKETFQLSIHDETRRPSFQWHITPSHYLEYPTKFPETKAVSVGVTTLHPESRGNIQWRNDGSFSIDPNYLSHAKDEEELLAAVKWTRDWIHHCPWRSVLGEELIPGVRRRSDESVRGLLKRLSSSIYHYIGTSAMGAESQSVCDPSFRVRGCEGLYVCDGSSLPEQVSGNPQVSIMLFGLKLAREIANIR